MPRRSAGLFRPDTRYQFESRAARAFRFAASGAAFTRQQDDLLGVTDSGQSLGFTATGVDPLALTDSVTVQTATVITRQQDDLLGLTDAQPLEQGKGVSDLLGLSDARAVAQTATVDDLLGVTDAPAPEVGKPVTDQVGITDSVTAQTAGANTRQIDDPLALTDARAVDQGKTADDPLALTDAAIAEVGKTVTDLLTLTDTQAVDYQLVITDSLGLTETVTPALSGAQATVRSSASFTSSGTSVTTQAAVLPTGWQAGDVVYIAAASVASGGGFGATPTNWTAVAASFDSGSSTSAHMVVYRRVMQVGDTAPTLALASGRVCGVSVAVQNANTTTPEDVAVATDNNGATPTTTVTAPSVTPAAGNDLLLTFHGLRNPTTADTSTTLAPPSGMTEIVEEFSDTNLVSGAAIEACSLALSGTSATGAKAATATAVPSGGTVNGMGVSVAVRSAAGGTPYAATVNDTLAVTDTAAAAAGHARTQDDLLSVTESVAVSPSLVTRTISDNAGLTDARLDLAKDYNVLATDLLGPTDAVTVQAAGANTRTIDDLLGVTESVTVQSAGTGTRTVADTLGLTDAAAADVGKTVSDLLGLTDTGAALTRTATGSDPLGLTDVVTPALNAGPASRTIDDLLTVSDGSQVYDYDTTQDDPLALTDSVTVQAAGANTRTITDPLGLTDAAAADQGKPVTDEVGITDTAVADVGKTITDPLALTDARIVDQGEGFTDPLGLTDQVTVQTAGAGTRSAEDLLSLIDTVGQVTPYIRTQTDTLSLTDAPAPEVGKPVTDSIALTDARGPEVGKNPTDQLGLTDSISVVMSWVRTVDDLLALTDGSPQGGVYSRTITDQVGPTDSITAQKLSTTDQTVADRVGLTSAHQVILTTTRPAIGTTIRPTTGRTSRPYAGVTSRYPFVPD